jgi:predicted phosphodiesterase
MPFWASLALRLLFCIAFGLGGALVALAASGPTEGRTALGTVSADVSPALGAGVVDAYVPILDWGVRSAAHPAPVDLQLEVRAVDRASAVEALRSGEDARGRVAAVRADVLELVQTEVRRSIGWALGGGIVGGLLAGALLAAFGRRWWLPGGAAAGVGAAGVAAAVSALVLGGIGEDAFERPVFYARGGELPQLLAFSEQITATTERYTESYEEALAGLDTLIAITGDPARPPAEPGLTAVVASDIHSNTLVLPALAEYAAGKVVFAVGDFAQLGTEYEWWVVDPVARLGARVVAVSGNHDSWAFMQRLAGAGVTVLTRSGRLAADGTTDGDPVVTVDGLAVAGYDDPLTAAGGVGEHDLELEGDELEREEQAFVAWFQALPERPDIVLVHQHALAHALVDALAPDGEPVVVLTGHDHEQHLDRRGPHLLVDGGTAGAGGPFAIGQQPAGFAQLHFRADGTLGAVDLVEIEPVSGAGNARRIPIAGLEDGAEEQGPGDEPSLDADPASRPGASS